jgi:hydrogenase-4 membrane subunit HyfE
VVLTSIAVLVELRYFHDVLLAVTVQVVVPAARAGRVPTRFRVPGLRCWV